jgi:hypothetical protein
MRWKEYVENNEIKNNKTVQRINEPKSWFFEMINNIAKPLVDLTRKSREKTQAKNN